MGKYSIIRADARNNQDDILPILKENLGETLREEKYLWKYQQCPYGVADCWLTRHEESGAFVGTAALFPRKMLVNGVPVCAAIAGDFAFDRQHRNLIQALALQREIQSKIPETRFRCIYCLPNDQARGIFSRIKYKKIGTFTHFVKPLKSEYRNKEYLHSLLQSKLAARAVDVFLKILSKENRYTTTGPYSVDTPDSFDDRFDVFWKKVAGQFSIIGERSSAFLTWRYMQSPGSSYSVFCVLDGRNAMSGYIVYVLDQNMCTIMDMLYEPSGDILRLLLAEFSRFMRRNGAGSISVHYLGGAFLKETLQEFNFLPITGKTSDVVFYSPDMADNPDLLNEENWHFFAGDNDV